MRTFELSYNMLARDIQLAMPSSEAGNHSTHRAALALAVARALEKENRQKKQLMKDEAAIEMLKENLEPKIDAASRTDVHILRLPSRHLPPEYEDGKKMNELLIAIAFQLKASGHIGKKDGFIVRP